ncbi:MAG: DNA methylase [Acidobacteria bacterium]|nr:DNA methylase [Acidobacteriota bacterium]
MSIEKDFDPAFATALALREKQIQQNYRPIIGVHKWFARRPGTIFRSLLLAEYNCREPLSASYWHSHSLRGVIADPFMGGGTPVFEASRLGFDIVGVDINPMAYWIVRQSLASLDLDKFASTAEKVVRRVESEVADLYLTACATCGQAAGVKYFVWVKTEECPNCGVRNDLFPGYMLAEAERHPKFVVACGGCGFLNEFDAPPRLSNPSPCARCGDSVRVDGGVRRQKTTCKGCKSDFAVPVKRAEPMPPAHRMWAIEYHCERCRPRHWGRFFKQPDDADREKVARASAMLARTRALPIPGDAIPAGDETGRLHRWGYRRYREMFTDRQLLGLGLLMRQIRRVADESVRHALLTVFSDFLRYQNMLCRYDTYSLKCQDIFSVHGFPVGLVQCENNLLGIPRIGSGAFRHFAEKYLRAKRYCCAPFETFQQGARKQIVPIRGERVAARICKRFPRRGRREAWLKAGCASKTRLPRCSLDGVFTDPPYFDNVQYAELMDFCYVWLRIALRREIGEFRRKTTRSPAELTGNETMSRGVEHFAGGISAIFRRYASALKPNAPFVFTYHHNRPDVYAPIVMAILDAGLDCSAVVPAAAEMNASLHIHGTKSSVLDSVFVCREAVAGSPDRIDDALLLDCTAMRRAGLRLGIGDVKCLLSGHIARTAINRLRADWDSSKPTSARLAAATDALRSAGGEADFDALVDRIMSVPNNHPSQLELSFEEAV